MDTTALSLCMDNQLPIHVFKMTGENIERVLRRRAGGHRRAARPPTAAHKGGCDVEKELLDDAKARMDKAVAATQTEFNTVRSGRASTGLLDRIHVDYYGTVTPLKQMANSGRARAAPDHHHALRQDAP